MFKWLTVLSPSLRTPLQPECDFEGNIIGRYGKVMALITREKVAKLAWFTLAWNVIVILWGAVVRASLSGNGCGEHWPLCGGHLIPTFRAIATVIEFLHRASTGVDAFLLVALAVGIMVVFPAGHAARKAMGFSMFFTFTEALLGAALVEFHLVDRVATNARVIAEATHLTNTLLLMAAVTATAWFASGGPRLDYQAGKKYLLSIAAALSAALLLCVSGGIAALADTIYPPKSLSDALRQDISGAAPIMIHLRVWHPIAAVAAILIIVVTTRKIIKLVPSQDAVRFASWCQLFCLLEFCAGLLNVVILAPIWMQVVHLLLADLLWISLVLMASAALARRKSSVEKFG